MKKLLIAGGLCGTTMLLAAEKLRDRCAKEGLTLEVVIQNLWETTYVRPDYDLIVEMFPYFEGMDCPVLSGKPFISHVGERALVEEIAGRLLGRGAAAS